MCLNHLKNKRVIIDICHPAAVHQFKNLYFELASKGWHFLFVAKHKDVTEDLLKAYRLPYVLFSSSQNGLLKKICRLPNELIAFYRLVKEFRPSLVLSNLSIHSSWISYFCRVYHIAFIDTDFRKLLDFFTLSFATVKLTPSSFPRSLGKNHFYYNGNHELAYLYKHRFLEKNVKKLLGLKEGDRFIIIRFVAWKAFHDVGQHGIKDDNKVRLIKWIETEFKKKVFIVSELKLPKELACYQLNISPELIHSILCYADAYVGEGITMASEAAVLGVPAILINSLKACYCLEELSCGLLYQYDTLNEAAYAKIREILSGAKVIYKQRLERYLQSRVDVTFFMVWFLKNFPNSVDELKSKHEIDIGFQAHVGFAHPN